MQIDFIVRIGDRPCVPGQDLAVEEQAAGGRQEAETSRLLRELIRIDTTNPPGRETPAAELLAAYLTAAGAECRLLARTPERANLVARIRGRGDGPSLMLLCHTDVVVADPGEWSVPPFEGLVRDGQVWGRGALDMKGQAAASAVALATLAAEGWQGNGDLLLCAVADEEVDVGCGLRWLVEAHPDAVRADYVLNEGGGHRVEAGGRVLYTVGVGETRYAAFAIETHGRSGHASTPSLADNALTKLAPAIERLARLAPPAPPPAALAGFLRAVGHDDADPRRLHDDWSRADLALASLLEPMLAGTVTPTVIDASRKSTVVPARARLVCDCRLLPGSTDEDLARLVAAALDGVEHAFEFTEPPVGGSASPAEGPLYDALARLVPELEPGATLAPTLFAGFTDSHWMREAFGSVAYGFMPNRMDPLLARGLMHSADERIPVADLGRAARFFVDVAREVGGL